MNDKLTQAQQQIETRNQNEAEFVVNDATTVLLGTVLVGQDIPAGQYDIMEVEDIGGKSAQMYVWATETDYLNHSNVMDQTDLGRNIKGYFFRNGNFIKIYGSIKVTKVG